MPGISGAARLVKTAATSKTTKTAAKKAAKSNIVKTAVSEIVVDAALPEIKERVAQRLNRDEDSQPAEQDQTLNPEHLGEWYEPTTLGLDSELYARYLRCQIFVLSDYEAYLEQYESPGYVNRIDSFYAQCEEPRVQLHVSQLLAESMESFIDHIENYAVRDDDFRAYVLNGPEKPQIELGVLSSDEEIREGLECLEEYIELCNDYVDYLCEYTDEDPEFASYLSSYRNLIKGDIQDLETIVIGLLRYINYLEQYAENDKEFKNHVARFSPDSEAYYSLVETENQLLKRAQGHTE